MARLPLDLYAEVTTASGATFRWDANQAPGSRLQNFSFRTKIGEGFSDASGSLARRIDFDYPDLNLVDTVTVVGADGSVAYEGRLQATPLSLSDKHSVGVTLIGWMAHAKDKKFREIYVDRDLSAWKGMSLARKAGLMTASFTPYDGEQTTDPTDAEAGISTVMQGAWASPYTPVAEIWYEAPPGLTIGGVGYSWKRESNAIDNANTNWSWQLYVSSDDKATATQSHGNLRAAGPGSLLTFNPTVDYRYALFNLYYAGTPAGLDGARFAIAYYKVAVYGNHSVPGVTGMASEPMGVQASEVLKNIVGRWCPRLDTSGVQDTSYVIQHLAFKDRTFPYDAFLEINKFHQWHLGVWEDKTLHFRPYDLTDYDWEVRTDDPGTTFEAQGPTTEDTYNGVVVTYRDLLTGLDNELSPDVYPELADSDLDNPWNRQGVDHWKEDVVLSTPALAADAVQLGRLALVEANRPKAAGTITVRGYIRDRQGNEQPVWKVRAGDTISATNFFDDVHLIVETDYDDEQKQLRIAVDFPFQLLEAQQDRVMNALQARNLS